MKFIAAAALALAALVAGAASAAPARFRFDWHGSTGWMPLQIASDHHAYFDLTVNGRAAVGMLDPNLAHTTLDAGFAARSGLHEGDLPTLGFTRLNVDGLAPAIRDLSPLSDALRHPVDVIVGSDALVGVVADIDLLGHRLMLADQAGYNFPSIARYTHLVRRGDIWLAPASIEGHRTALFVLDTLSGDDLQLAPDYANELGLAPSVNAVLVGDDGAVPVGRIGLHQIKFAGVVMQQVTADVLRQLPAAYAAAGAQGALGVGVLRRYRVILDLQHERLYTLLIANPGLEMPIFTLLHETPVPDFGPKPSGF